MITLVAELMSTTVPGSPAIEELVPADITIDEMSSADSTRGDSIQLVTISSECM